MTVPADWGSFAEVIGTSSGSLTGLLFVAVSLNAGNIRGHRGLRASAAQTLVLFLTPLIMAATLLAPGQADWVFGAELIAIGLTSSWVLLSIGRRKQTLDDDERSLVEIFNRRTPNIVVMLLFVAAGIVLVGGSNNGLYLLLPASLIAFISGVVNAWYFLLPPRGPREPQEPRHPRAPGEPRAATESP